MIGSTQIRDPDDVIAIIGQIHRDGIVLGNCLPARCQLISSRRTPLREHLLSGKVIILLIRIYQHRCLGVGPSM